MRRQALAELGEGSRLGAVPTNQPIRRPGLDPGQGLFLPRKAGPRVKHGATVCFGHGKAPAGERGLSPKRRSNGRRPVHGCPDQTGVAARRSLRTTDGESHETVHSAALWHRAATARTRVLSVSRGGIPPVEIAGADRARSRCPSAFAMLTASEHRPSTRSQKRSANRLRTRCGRACNRYGDKCQGCSPDQNT